MSGRSLPRGPCKRGALVTPFFNPAPASSLSRGSLLLAQCFSLCGEPGGGRTRFCFFFHGNFLWPKSGLRLFLIAVQQRPILWLLPGQRCKPLLRVWPWWFSCQAQLAGGAAAGPLTVKHFSPPPRTSFSPTFRWGFPFKETYPRASWPS